MKKKISNLTYPKSRQRSNVENGLLDLMDSLQEHGQIQPIVITKSGRVVAGGRRFTAAKRLKWTSIDVKIIPDDTDLTIIEFIENFHRKGISWQDEAIAILSMTNEGKSREEIVRIISGLSVNKVSQMVTLAKTLKSDPEHEIHKLPTIGAAWNLFSKKKSREQESEILNILDPVSLEGEEPPLPLPLSEGDAYAETVCAVADARKPPSQPVYIHNKSALELFQTQKGFNVIHCDFPYGIDHDKNGLGATTKEDGIYQDSAEVHDQLLEGMMSNLHTLIPFEGYILYWYAISLFTQRKAQIEALALKYNLDLIVDPVPFIWHRSDNKGMIAYPGISLRRTYEAAFIIRVNQAQLFKSGPASVTWPTEASTRPHPSYKPRHVTETLLSSFVDPSTRILDPTCGSGSALASANKLGATFVEGWDINKEHCINAKREILKAGTAGKEGSSKP